LKQQNFQQIEVGETFGPVKFPVDDHFQKGFAFAVDDWSPLYFGAPGTCGPFGHSSGIAKKLLHIFMEGYDPQGIKAVHLKEDIWFHAPVPFGETITLSGEYTDKFVRKGRPSAVLEGEARDSRGNLLVRQRSVEIVDTLEPLEEIAPQPTDLLSARRVNAVWPEGREPAASAADVVAVDTPLPVLTKTIHQDQMSMFVGANDNWKNIHTDPDIAREAGFDSTIMSGMIQVCWFSEMMVSFFGASFLTGGQLGATFLAPVKSRETIELKAVVRAIHEDGSLEIEFWSTNADGKMTSAGWAIGGKQPA
jgi:acyl dehydratase